MKDPKPFGLNELREMFLKFFETKGHLRLPSFPSFPRTMRPCCSSTRAWPHEALVHRGAGAPRRRVTTCQKCIRTGDIENIGHTARHGTYFEMLGNFSFGDYFKTEAIHWPGSSSPARSGWGWTRSGSTPRCSPATRPPPPTTRPSASGTRRSASPPSASSSSARRTTSGSTAPAPAAPARDLLRPGPRVGLRQARLHRGLRLRPVYRGVERGVLPVRQ